MNESIAKEAAPPDVFVSYSSEDREMIAPIVQLLCAMKKGLVFQDYVSVLPGQRWREEVTRALHQAKTVIVFWCTHSAASDWVQYEYETGIEENKEMIPVLLDDTELPEPLGAFQWIDLRRAGSHGGVSDFEEGTYRRSKRHYYPLDSQGQPCDWDFENFKSSESERRKKWKENQGPRFREIADAIVKRLG